MRKGTEGPTIRLRRAKEEADKHVRLSEILEHLAHAEEQAAAALVDLDLTDEADELLQSAVDHYRWAAQAAEQAKEERTQESELMNESARPDVSPSS